MATSLHYQYSMNKHTISFALATLLLTLMSSCIPQMESPSGNVNLSSASDADMDTISLQLSKVYSGRQVLNDINALKNNGYTVQFKLASQADLQSLNGHTGGGFTISDTNIIIYINNLISIQEQAHVVAHEMVHILDDKQIESIHKSYPHVRVAAEDFVLRYSTTSINSFNQRVVSYVLGTLFCTEARAYTKNQLLHNEGLYTNVIPISAATMPQMIDQNYIKRFGTQYGSKASAMFNWCLNQASMTNIQYKLIW